MTELETQIPIKIVQTEKFKTISLTVFFKSTMDENRVAARNLLSKMMIKRTSQFKTEIDLLEHLSKYYGAHLTSSTYKRGSDHVVSLCLEFVNDKFILEDLDVFSPMVELLKDILHSPSMYNLETKSYFDKELRLYKGRLKNNQDNRSLKGFEQMLDVMFEDHPMRMPGYGSLKALENLTLADVQEEYTHMIENDEAAIVLVGDIDKSAAAQFEGILNKSKPVKLTNESYTFPDTTEVNDSVSTMKIEQAKLNIGFTIKVNDKIDRINLSAVNQMFGGSVNAFLFTNVREKMSLAYQIFSSVDARNGFLYVMAGVDDKNVEIAKSAILKELERIKNGDFDDAFVDEIKLMMLVNRQESQDRPKGLTGIAYNQLITGKVTDYELLLTHVTKEKIMDIANRLSMNTVHVLTGGNTNEN